MSGQPEEVPRCKVCGKLLEDWQPGMPLICSDDNPNRRHRDAEPGPASRATTIAEARWAHIWYLAAP